MGHQKSPDLSLMDWRMFENKAAYKPDSETLILTRGMGYTSSELLGEASGRVDTGKRKGSLISNTLSFSKSDVSVFPKNLLLK